MSENKRTNHTEWDWKYHIIFIPKYRKKVLCGKLRERLGAVFKQLAHRKEIEIWIARNFGEVTRGFVGKSFWARGYFVSTVGRDEETIRKYIQHQESEGRRINQLNLMQLAPNVGAGAKATPGVAVKPSLAAHNMMPPALPEEQCHSKRHIPGLRPPGACRHGECRA